MHDPRVGKFLSIDPLAGKHPGITPYGFCNNNPILFIDPDGRDWFVNDQGFYIWSNSSSYGNFTYAGNTLPKGLDHYMILERINGELYHKNTNNLFASIGNKLGGNFVEKKPYDHAEESFNEEMQSTAFGVIGFYGVGKLGGWALNALTRSGGSLWKIAGVGKGFVFEEMMGGNLVRNYPVIDKFIKGVATSIKTLDLKAKTYENADKVYGVLKGYIDKLANFKGAIKGGVDTTEGAISKKILEVGIPKNATIKQIEAIQKAVKYAKDTKDITVNVTVVK
jgi:hypothetical protein